MTRPKLKAIEGSLAELEVQNSAAQQVLCELVAEMEALYAELEEQAADIHGESAPTKKPGPQQEEIELLRRERDSVQQQILQVRRCLQKTRPANTAAWEDIGLKLLANLDELGRPHQLSQTGGVSVRSPFEELRQELESSSND